MVAEAVVHVDVNGAVRAWARAALPSLSGRVFFAVNNAAAFPQVTIPLRLGPDDEVLIQFDCWGAPKDKGGSKAQAETLGAQLATALDALTTFTYNGVRLHGASKPRRRWAPDEATDQPREIVEATIFATAA